MNEFIKILLSLSVSGALLLLLILGLKPLYKNKFSKRWQYYIWIVVALRFLLPFTPDTTIVGSLFEKFDTAAITNEIPTSPNVPVPADTGNSKAEPTQTNREITTAAMREPFNKYVCLFFIWSALALVLFVRKVTVYQGFIQYIKAGNKEVSDIKILNLLSDCEEKLNIKTRVELSRNSLIASPMMIGFFRPRIILPVGELEDKELSYIFVHELIHYKQRDMFYKWLIQIVVCAHWFNPFVYLLEREVNKSCELSCDEIVLSVLDDSAKREYGDTLIFFFKSNNLYKSSLASVTLTEGAEQLKERLGAIMKFRKKSKVVIAITAIFTVAVCVCFFVTGAYAAPSVANDMKTWKGSEILNEVLTEDGVYYIFCDGAGENDKPLSSVSAGSIKIVLVRKDSYTSIGPFDNMETLMEDVAGQCEYMNTLTQEEKDLVIETAAKIVENNKGYTYVQRGFYSDSYIIEMGWNLSDTLSKEYANSKEITLEDNSVIKVYFDENTVDYLNDSNAISAIGKLLYSLNNGDMQNYPTIEIPLITNVTYVSENNLSILADEYFQNNNLTGFSAIFPVLDTELQKEYCQKIYDDNKIAFFSSIIPYMDRDLVTLYADKSDQDQKVNFFSVILGYMQSDDLNQYAEKYYEANNISYFTILVDYMTKEERQEWIKRAQTDKKTNFVAVLSD
ncbi:M56 family metallopeptidase [Acetatifactor muris]|uniref:Regulatory protein BlaR1 n=1 Tax=Acetatifactor muris TaxID=879566 RepID=A0A2K4ZLK1_9FIRM|nr:M56 family metallopeptidase [Acetatifactor muris]MCR2051151.1 M56 family metallopeptidase [Acetatifactor muris]SOY31364.1 Regulatory protein BlaR1 [Acetatifactor muris]